MATAKRSYVYSDIAPDLLRRLNGDSFDGPAISEIWERYLADRNQADFSSLVEHYLPEVWFASRRAKRLSPNVFNEPLGDYVSDATLGLMQGIRRIEYFIRGGTLMRLRREVRRSLWNEVRARSWAGRRRLEQLRTLQKIRAELTRETGNVPTREEVAARLATQVSNPNIYLDAMDDTGRRMLCASQRERNVNGVTTAGEVRQFPDSKVPSPDQGVMDAEVIRLALKGLSGPDRKILRLTLQGKSPADIAAKIGIHRSCVVRRLNGVLWEARTRADLAAHLGVEPDTAAPAKVKSGGGHANYPTFRPTPARRVAG